MAVKFSQFTAETNAANITSIVGYTTGGNLNVQIPPANLDTTYALSTTQATNDVDLRLTGTKPGTAGTTEDVKFVAGTAIGLTAGTDQMTIANTGVTSFTNENGTFISAATANTTATGAVTMGIIDLSAGTPSSPSTEFLRGDNTWAVPTDVANTYTLPITGNSGAVTATLTGSSGDTDPVLITAGTDISFASISTGGFTINSTATGGVSSVDETTPGVSTGTPIVVNPTTGTVLVQSMAYAGQGNVGHVPAGGSAGQYLDGDTGAWTTLPSTLSISKQTFTGDNTTTDFTLTTPAGCTADNLSIYISGVYQNSVDSSNAVNYTVGSGLNPTLQFVSAGTPTAPPVTATRGIEVVITR